MIGQEIKEGTPVTFRLSLGIYGKGVICGKSTNPVPILGYGYIIRHTELSISYNYSTLTAFENQFVIEGKE